MNISDVRTTTRDQHDFWHICASAVLTIALFSAVAVVLRLVWHARRSLRNEAQKRDGFLMGPVNTRLDVGVV